MKTIRLTAALGLLTLGILNTSAGAENLPQVVVHPLRPTSQHERDTLSKLPNTRLAEIPDDKLLSEKWRHEMLDRAALLPKAKRTSSTADAYGESQLIWMSISEDFALIKEEFPTFTKAEVERLAAAVSKNLGLSQ